MNTDRLFEAIVTVNQQAKWLREDGWSVDLSSGYEKITAYVQRMMPEVRTDHDDAPAGTVIVTHDAKNDLK